MKISKEAFHNSTIAPLSHFGKLPALILQGKNKQGESGVFEATKKGSLVLMSRERKWWRGQKWSLLSPTQKVFTVILYAVGLYMAFSVFVGLFIPA